MMAPSTSRSLQSPDNSRFSYYRLDTFHSTPEAAGWQPTAEDQANGLAWDCAQSFHVGVHTGEYGQCSSADG
jgi:hypothetical protein